MPVTDAQQSAVTVAIVNDYPVVVQGVAALLAPYLAVEVVQIAAKETPTRPVDVILFDTFAARDQAEEMAQLRAESPGSRLVVYSWHSERRDIERILAQGADGFVSKTAGGDILSEAILKVHQGEYFVHPSLTDVDPANPDWPGKAFGLSHRESEVLSLIARGASNEEIAQICFLSINSVKSYIRSAYRKIGVSRRSQAVIWAIQNGLEAQHRSYVRNVD